MQPEKNSLEKFKTTAEEFSHLEEKAYKEYVLQHEGKQSLEQASRSALEKYAKRQALEVLDETRVLPEKELEQITLKLTPETHDKQIEELLALALEKGIKNALDVTAKLKNPHLEDDFHRYLVQYMQTIGLIPGIKENSPLAKELRHSLFTVTLPASTTGNDFKNFIQAMKQFYAGMNTICESAKDHYTLELAVQNNSKDITFYVSVPTDHEATFEKLVNAYYPTARIEAAHDDYNIFSGTGDAVAGATMKLSEPSIFPLSTDENFSHDPLAALIGSLSKLEEHGEGAAIQILITNDEKNHNKLYDDVRKAVEKGGVTVSDYFKEINTGIISGIGKDFFSLFSSKKDDSENNKKIDSTGLEFLQIKNQSKTTLTSIRIITSAKNISRAQSMLTTIKAGFAQFALLGSNEISWNDIAHSHIHSFSRSFAFRSFDTKEAVPLSINELATIFHFPVGIQSSPELSESAATTAPAPSGMKSDGVFLGTNNYRGTTTDVYLGKEDRVRHTYVIGQTGTGKTTILKNMVIQDIKNGHGVCFMDPHGSDLEDILANIPPERLDDVIYFDPAYTARPMGLNMLEYDERYPEQKIFVINELLSIFNKLFDMKTAGGPMFEQYFRNSAGLVMEDPSSGSTLLEIGRVLSDKAFRELKLSRCKNPIIKQFWENAEKTTGESALTNFVPYITNKFDVFISNDIMRPVIAQQHSVLNFRDIMDKKKILLVNLSKGRLGDINSHLIGLLLVGKITMAALSRVDTLGRGEVNDFYLYIDEFQNVTTDSITTILSEARKYRLGLIVAHQYIEQLDTSIKDAVFGNVGNMIIYRVSPENAKAFEEQLAPIFTPADILKLQNFNAYAKILVQGSPQKPFSLRIPPPPKGNIEITDKVKELSYLKYGRPRADVEAEIFARYK